MKIFTYSFNNPIYLAYQYKCLKKFSIEPFELICIDNSIDNDIRHELQNVCKNNKITYQINKKPNHSSPGISHYSAIQWSYNRFIIYQKELVLMLDHDIFPIFPFSISEILNDALMAGAPQQREHIVYLHPSILILNPDKLPNKNTLNFGSKIFDGVGVDVGGQLHTYIYNNPHVKIKYLKSHLLPPQSNLLPLNCVYDGNNPFEIIEDKFLHTRLGSNWSGINSHEFSIRNKLIYNLLDEYLK
jgi:hypothetical protein